MPLATPTDSAITTIAIRKRESLITLLSPDWTCAECGGQVGHPRELEVDHVNGITWNRRAVSAKARVDRYWTEYETGIRLRALCDPCNGRDGANRQAADDSPDRDTWVTPLWLARALGRVYLDPCSNERSHIDAERTFDFDRRGEDGLRMARYVSRRPPGLVFVNPPYSRGNVIRWVNAYKHTRFCFAELWTRTGLVVIPTTRINFDPPPDVAPHHPTSNPFPHALLYARAEDATQAILDLCYVMKPSRS
jgi:hypothetical protein